MDGQALEVMIALVVLGGAIVIASLQTMSYDKKYTDPSMGKGRFVDRSEAFNPKLHRNQLYRVKRIRQSGNEEVYQQPMTGYQAINVVKSTFSRSMAGGFTVRKDTVNELTVDRGYYHARGTQEGKKIRMVVIEAVNPIAVEDRASSEPERNPYERRETRDHPYIDAATRKGRKITTWEGGGVTEYVEPDRPITERDDLADHRTFDIVSVDVLAEIVALKMNPDPEDGSLTFKGSYRARGERSSQGRLRSCRKGKREKAIAYLLDALKADDIKKVELKDMSPTYFRVSPVDEGLRSFSIRQED